MKKKGMKHIVFDGTSFHDKRCSNKYSVDVNARIMLGDYDGLFGWLKKQIDRLRYPKTPHFVRCKKHTGRFNQAECCEQSKRVQDIPFDSCSCERSAIKHSYPDATAADTRTTEIFDSFVDIPGKQTLQNCKSVENTIGCHKFHKIIKHVGGTRVVEAQASDKRNQQILKRW